jgi:hypothetical protein
MSDKELERAQRQLEWANTYGFFYIVICPLLVVLFFCLVTGKWDWLDITIGDMIGE